MAHSSILGGQHPPEQASGKNTGALGPSDSSDSGSDVQGELLSTETGDAELRESAVTVDLDSDGDSAGTGDRGAAVPDGARDNADIETDSERDLFDDPLDAEAADVDVDVDVDVDADADADADAEVDDIDAQTPTPRKHRPKDAR